MDSSLKQRLVGAVVLIALAVIFLPMLVKGPAPDSGVSDVSLEIPAEPSTGMETRDLPLTSPTAAPEGGAVGLPAASQAPVVDAAATNAAYATTAAGDYAVSFGSYGSVGDADKVIAALRSAELPAYREAVQLNGREAQRVRIGPFADRAVAESARLRAAHVNDTVGAKVIALDAGNATPAPATATASTAVAVPAPTPVKTEPLPSAPKPAAPTPVAAAKPTTGSQPAAVSPTKPATTTAPATPVRPAAAGGTGFAVQVGAFADAAAATALRDKLRVAGFNAFTDSVDTDAGRRTRVRVGPAMTRAEAEQLKASVQAKVGIAGMVRPHP